jgi:GNAT superfamily N-acetyltransferase
MSYNILTLKELGAEYETGVATLRFRAFGEMGGAEILRRRIAQGSSYSDYAALYAVDEDELLSMVEVPRMTFTSKEGTEPCSGLAYVSTRPKVAHRGISKRLVEEVISREKAAGSHWMLLWTGRALVAHSFYERLGFRDVWQWPHGIRQVPEHQDPPAGYTLRAPEMKELGSLEELREDVAKGRLGFVQRHKGYLTRSVKLGESPLSDIMALFKGKNSVGYALLRSSYLGTFTCGEMVASTPENRAALVQALESRTAGNWLSLNSSPHEMWAPLLSGRGYQVSTDSWGVLMALPLTKELTVDQMRNQLGTNEPGFISQAMDTF